MPNTATYQDLKVIVDVFKCHKEVEYTIPMQPYVTFVGWLPTLAFLHQL